MDPHALTAGLYLLAAAAATLGVSLRSPRLRVGAVIALAVGAAVHTAAFFELHRRVPPPPLTDLPAVVSSATWMATVFFLSLLAVRRRRGRLAALAVLVAPAAFLGAFYAALALPASGPPPQEPASWSHTHVLLASGGLALLGVAGGAGVAFVWQHRQLKAKRRGAGLVPLPSLEALDRVNAVTVSLGFLLLTLGVVTGVLWVHSTRGILWPGDAHANATLLAWGVYGVLLAGRYAAGQGARQCAVSAVAGFGLLLVAVVGVELAT